MTGKDIPEDEFNRGFSRLELTWDPVKSSLLKNGGDHYGIGFLDKNPDFSGIYDLTILNQVLQGRGLPEIEQISTY